MTIFNPPGLSAVDYRVGDYTSFRRALLTARPGEQALAGWHPTAEGDLALQLLEWWAYLGDVLTFYNERAIQEVLLRTATLPEDVRRIIRLLGYRPRPGIGATGVVAALTDTPRGFVVPRGFGLEGTSPPGGSAQVFEVDDDVDVGSLGRPLPFSAKLDPTLSTAGRASRWRGPTPRGAKGLLLNRIPAQVPDDPKLNVKEGLPFKVVLDGVTTTIKHDDLIVLLKRDWDGNPLAGFTIAAVSRVRPIWDAFGHAVTEVTAVAAHALDEAAERKDYRVLKPTKLAHLWLYHDRYAGATLGPGGQLLSIAGEVGSFFADPIGTIFGAATPKLPPQDPSVLTMAVTTDPPPPHGAAHLEAICRGISAGDPVLFENRNEGGIFGLFQLLALMIPGNLQTELPPLRDVRMQMAKVLAYTEEIWYANPPQLDKMGIGPPVGPPTAQKNPAGPLGDLFGIGGDDTPPAPIPIPHSKITFLPNQAIGFMALMQNTIVVHYDWKEVGEIVPTPPPPKTKSYQVPTPSDLPTDEPLPVLVRDATGRGVLGFLGEIGSVPDDEEPLVPPLEALWNLLPVSRGQTVAREVLGSGDPMVTRQQFVLKKSPLTYLADPDVVEGTGYRSTLRIRVDGIEWREAPSFYGQPPNARVFVTREDDEERTHVRFGDGQHGARLPAGRDNVVATYRHGSGLLVPPIGTLTSILTPLPGLQAIENPIQPSGGSDPDPPEQVRRYAPRSVLTFGRAVSGDDYETVAAQTPGVKRAHVRWGWDGETQRSLVKVFVGDDAAAVENATAALRKVADPNRPFLVAAATPEYPDLTLTLEVDRTYDLEMVRGQVENALLDPRSPLFGVEVVAIGQTIYDSHIYDACLRVPGVMAVRLLRFAVGGVVQIGERHAPSEGRFYLLSGDHLHVTAEAARHAE